MKFLVVGGTRPNFIKIAPLLRAFNKRKISPILVHTGQHYDNNMSSIFFFELGIKIPDYNLEVGSGSHAVQTAEIMKSFEYVCNKEKPNTVIVVGDVNSTLACSLVVSKLKNVKLAHVEAGGRAFDKSLPEETNRIVTDVLSDYLFAIESNHVQNLLNEGVPENKIFLVGDTIIDNLVYNNNKIRKFRHTKKYMLVTLHRDINVDDRKILKNILKSLDKLSKYIRIYFPIHPRTKNNIETFGLDKYLRCLECMPPIGNIKFTTYLSNASILLTDSGGAEVEAMYLGIPCVTMRNSTEHIITLENNANTLVGNDKSKIVDTVLSLINNPIKVEIPRHYKELADGNTSDRIVDILLNRVGKNELKNSKEPL